MDKILFEILNELDRAKAKHPVWPTCNIGRAAIVNCEAGEALKEAIKISEGTGSLENLRTELIQTAATSIRMMQAMDEDKRANKEQIYYTNNL